MMNDDPLTSRGAFSMRIAIHYLFAALVLNFYGGQV